jgi:predicted secreted protein
MRTPPRDRGRPRSSSWNHGPIDTSRGNRSVRFVVYAVPIQQIDQGQRPGCWSTRRETGTMTQNTIPGALRPLLGLLVIGLVAIGCTSATARAAEMGAGCDQFAAQKSITQTTEMSVGDQVKVTLCSNPTTGFSWQEPEISDAATVSLADKTFGAPVAGSGQVVGAAGTDTITLKATAKGTSTVVLRYSQPWAGGISGEWTYALTVTVR